MINEADAALRAAERRARSSDDPHDDLRLAQHYLRTGQREAAFQIAHKHAGQGPLPPVSSAEDTPRSMAHEIMHKARMGIHAERRLPRFNPGLTSRAGLAKQIIDFWHGSNSGGSHGNYQDHPEALEGHGLLSSTGHYNGNWYDPDRHVVATLRNHGFNARAATREIPSNAMSWMDPQTIPLVDYHVAEPAAEPAKTATRSESVDFFSIYGRLNRSLFHEAALSVDSNRDVTSRGNAHNDKTLTDPNTRDKILHARVQEIEAFAKDKGIDPLIVLGVAEAALRTGRVPNLSMYGLGGDSMVAVKHFIAGEILNLAGMEAINWDGTKIEESVNLAPEHQRALKNHYETTARRLGAIVQKHFKDEEDGKHVAQETISLFKHILHGKPGNYKPERGARDAQDYYFAAQRALSDNQDAVNKALKFDAANKEHQDLLGPHISAANERIMSLVTTHPGKKQDTGTPKGETGVPTEIERRGKQASTGEHGAKRRGGSVGGPQTDDIEIKGQLQQEYGSPSDRNSSPVSNLTGAPSAAANHPTEPGKKMLQGSFDKSTFSKIEKGMANVAKNEKTGKNKGQPTKLQGLLPNEIKNLGTELGALNTGESMDADHKKLLNIEPGDPREEIWPKVSPELKKLLNLESRGLYFKESKQKYASAVPHMKCFACGRESDADAYCKKCDVYASGTGQGVAAEKRAGLQPDPLRPGQVVGPGRKFDEAEMVHEQSRRGSAQRSGSVAPQAPAVKPQAAGGGGGWKKPPTAVGAAAPPPPGGGQSKFGAKPMPGAHFGPSGSSGTPGNTPRPLGPKPLGPVPEHPHNVPAGPTSKSPPKPKGRTQFYQQDDISMDEITKALSMLAESIGTKTHTSDTVMGSRERVRQAESPGPPAMRKIDYKFVDIVHSMLPVEHQHEGARRLIAQMMAGGGEDTVNDKEAAALPEIKRVALTFKQRRSSKPKLKIDDVETPAGAQLGEAGVGDFFKSQAPKMVGSAGAVGSILQNLQDKLRTLMPGTAAYQALEARIAKLRAQGAGRTVNQDDYPDTGENMAETTMSGVIGGFMKLGNPRVSRPSQIADWDAPAADFQPARLGMVTPDPVLALEAVKSRNLDAAIDTAAEAAKSGQATTIWVHKNDPTDVHVQIHGKDGRAGERPGEDYRRLNFGAGTHRLSTSKEPSSKAALGYITKGMKDRTRGVPRSRAVATLKAAKARIEGGQ